MAFTIHNQILLTVFAVAVVMGAVVNKTNFCTMGAVSDWINIGDSGRMRAWVFAMAIAVTGVLVLEAAGTIRIGTDTFPPYRTPQFAWLRYIAGGLLFGIGMTLAGGCGNKTLVRVGNGSLKSLIALVVAAVAAYFMLWSALFEKAFLPWIVPTTIDLGRYGIADQGMASVIAAMFGLESTNQIHYVVGVLAAGFLYAFAFRSADFRQNRDNILGGGVVGLAIVAGWWITGGPWGAEWKEFAQMSFEIPSRVATQSYTFVSPMGDSVRYLLDPGHLAHVNFGVVALAGMIAGSFLYALASGGFRLEWFANGRDFANYAAGGALMGIGGVLAMGCTVGQGITGVSTLAVGSILAFFSIVVGAAGTMKYQYWRLLQEA